MPLAKIETRRPRTAEEVQAIMDAINLAQREALQVPASDRQTRYIEHKTEHFHVPPGKSDNYTLVEIALFSGRSLHAKRALDRAIVSRFGALGIAPGDIFIVPHEIPLENWGVRGGVPASEVDLGFRVDV